MNTHARKSILFLALIGLSYCAVLYKGVNEAVAEFGSAKPGTYGTDYTYPTTASIDYFVSKGMNMIRFPFLWERVQRSLGGALDTTEMGRMDSFVDYVTNTKGVYILLDPHNYARYNDKVIGESGSGVTAAHFADLWTKLANRYKANSKVWFGIMNEPNTMDTTLWKDDCQAAINAIRATGATNMILVPGVAWTGAHSWLQNWYGTPNGDVMGAITDSGNNFAYELHQYLDNGFSGTNENCVSATIGSEKLAEVTGWLRARGKKGFLGEFGAGRNSQCYSAITDILNYMETNSDVWIGWTWWASGPWWGDYIFTLEPSGSTDRPQMQYIQPFLTSTSSASGTTGVSSSSSNTGVSSTTGVRSTTGVSSASSTTSVTGSTTGVSSASGTTGVSSASGTTGVSSASGTTGVSSASGTTGVSSASTTGNGGGGSSSDTILISSGNDQIPLSGRFNVEVTVSTTTTRFLLVEVFDVTTNQKYGQGTLQTGATAKATVTITVSITTPIPDGTECFLLASINSSDGTKIDGDSRAVSSSSSVAPLSDGTTDGSENSSSSQVVASAFLVLLGLLLA